MWVAPALLVMLLVIGYPFVYTIDLSFYDTPPSSPNWYFKNGVYTCDSGTCRSNYKNLHLYQK